MRLLLSMRCMTPKNLDLEILSKIFENQKKFLVFVLKIYNCLLSYAIMS